jgi:hypothetical protein
MSNRITGLVLLTGPWRLTLTASFGPAYQQQVGPLPPDIREQYSGENGAIIDDGIKALKQALSLRPDYDDAMAYLNLLYRREADVVESPTERDELIKQADDLIDKVKEIKSNRAKPTLSPNAKPE